MLGAAGASALLLVGCGSRAGSEFEGYWADWSEQNPSRIVGMKTIERTSGNNFLLRSRFRGRREKIEIALTYQSPGLLAGSHQGARFEVRRVADDLHMTLIGEKSFGAVLKRSNAQEYAEFVAQFTRRP